MNFRHALLFSLLLFLTGLFIGCGCPNTPEEKVDAAGKAMDDGNYDKAHELYQEILSWKGEGEVSGSLRFQATLESCKCLAYLERYEEAVADFKMMEKSFEKEMGVPTAAKYALQLGRVFEVKVAPVAPIVDLLQYAGEKYPDKKKDFGGLVKAIEAGRDLTDEEKDKFKGLGYL